MVKGSFKVTGLSLSLDGSENSVFRKMNNCKAQQKRTNVPPMTLLLPILILTLTPILMILTLTKCTLLIACRLALLYL